MQLVSSIRFCTLTIVVAKVHSIPFFCKNLGYTAWICDEQQKKTTILNKKKRK